MNGSRGQSHVRQSLSHRFSLRAFVAASILIGCGSGYGVRWWLTPYCSRTYYENGKVSAEAWQRRTLLGSIEVVDDRPHRRYYSNGVKSYEGMPRDHASARYFDPNGQLISHADWWDYHVRDLGNGHFESAYPYTDGRQQPLAREFDSPPD